MVFAAFTTVSHQGLHSELHGESLSGAHAPFEGWICCRVESFGDISIRPTDGCTIDESQESKQSRQFSRELI